MRAWLSLTMLIAAVGVAVPYLYSFAELEEAPPRADVAAAPADSGGEAYGPRTVTLMADSRGHFTIEATVNGRTVAMLADTGASSVVLTHDDARRAGFNPGSLTYSVPVSTANGTAYVAKASLDVIEVDGIVLRNVEALIAQPEVLNTSLLGMSFIGRLERFSLEGRRLVLVE